ncbi:MurR/RpiR family transcriptional regulator [Sphaerotilus mobilis]|uniref:RpiR family transcriptional regulator n=1 Tax=Sphaerotilus mobilis TaxID=47994 RepID=A0A4Q7LE73_9BURK|nr:MurR/RpiR family transcriptional regulator [Sphaerotilus mobilis]RZS52292.1 RpiR family transcriptional regulator [Sphaerotilus mobilis]
MENVSLDLRGGHPPSRLLLAMQRELPALSPKLGHVARFCIEHAATLHHHRIQDVARASGTIPASVVRLAKRFGLSGFQELKYALVERAEREKPDLVEPADDGLHPDSACALEDIEASALGLGSLKGLVARPEFRLAVQALRGARRIHVIAAGPTDETIATHLRGGLQVVRPDPGSPAQPGDWLVQVAVWQDLTPETRPREPQSYGPRVLSLARGRMNRFTGGGPDGIVMRLGTDSRRLLNALALSEALTHALHPDRRAHD